MKLVIASDHAGVELKSALVAHLQSKGIDVADLGPFSTDSVNYPDYAHAVATQVEAAQVEKGILICGSGVGVSIVANKHKGVRAALVWRSEIAELCRQHNNANVMCLPARFIETEEAIRCVDLFLSTVFEGGRHQMRVDLIEEN